MFGAGAFPAGALAAGALASAAGLAVLCAFWALPSPFAGAPLPTSTGTGSPATGAVWPPEAWATWTPEIGCSPTVACSSEKFETASNSILVVIVQPPSAFPGKRHAGLELCNVPSIFLIYSNMHGFAFFTLGKSQRYIQLYIFRGAAEPAGERGGSSANSSINLNKI
ncbi:hypothetical protein [Mesorhizobium sp.]|uniref:hypothetical protein n=1 Tax=Mesorhizobium sp. TaxID=1871066 RepID=UPI0025C21320|nr:hypothetical protein [Mesorhizobium sp.]